MTEKEHKTRTRQHTQYSTGTCNIHDHDSLKFVMRDIECNTKEQHQQ